MINSNKNSNNRESKTFMDKIARILVSLSDGKNSVTDIAHQCNLSTSATHRLLNVLAESSFAVRDPINHKYYLGPLINNLQ
jgi:DNA-binding IclR family transcriptional regulator